MKRSVQWLLLILAGIILLPFLYFMWPGVFVFTVVGGMVIFKAKFPVIKGLFGEWQVTRILNKLGEEYRVFNDLYVPKEDGGMTQVDHIVTSPYGIFVIETKHYTGWIFGSENQAQWTQVIYKRKEKLYNPIRQNYGHVMALKSYLENEKAEDFQSVIAFSSQSTFKFKEPFKSAAVVQFPDLSKTILEKRDAVFGNQELLDINKKLERLVISDRKEKKKVKKEHLKVLKNRETIKSSPRPANKKVFGRTGNSSVINKQPLANRAGAAAELCADCGSEMKLKKGRYGSFYGCSNYPVCRHTKKIAESS